MAERSWQILHLDTSGFPKKKKEEKNKEKNKKRRLYHEIDRKVESVVAQYQKYLHYKDVGGYFVLLDNLAYIITGIFF